ncbi:MAG: hypothetical protein WA902_06420 [Thermosynechococcaceae cyanobacterium]
MTQAIDTNIRNLIENLDRKIDTISTDVVEMKVSLSTLNERFNSLEATTDERFKSIDQRLGSLEDRFKTQDNRIWSLVVDIFLALFGLLAKVAFFPAMSA